MAFRQRWAPLPRTQQLSMQSAQRPATSPPPPPHQPVGPMGAPTSGQSPASSQTTACTPRRTPPLPQPLRPMGPRAPVWGGGGSLAALPRLMLHLGTGIYPLAQLGAINSCWDGCQGCSGCQHKPCTGLGALPSALQTPTHPTDPHCWLLWGSGCLALSSMGAHLPAGGALLPSCPKSWHCSGPCNTILWV